MEELGTEPFIYPGRLVIHLLKVRTLLLEPASLWENG